MSTIPIAVLGTGIMGGAMARRWAGHDFAVTAWNRDRAKAEALVAGAGAGALTVAVAETPAAAVAGAEVVVTMLADGAATEAVMADALPALAAGATWIQMGTVGLDATARLAARASAADDVGFVDAPVSGTRQPAEQGLLTVFASGPQALRDRCDRVFAPVAARVLWVGDDAGAGSRLKLVVNHWLAALVAGLAEAIALAEGLGVDPRRFLDAIEGGPLGSGYATVKGAMMVDRDYPTAFPLHLLAKDVALVAEAAEGAEVPLRLPAAVADLLAAALPAHADADMSAVVEALRRG